MKETHINLRRVMDRSGHPPFPDNPTPEVLDERYEGHPEVLKVDIYLRLVPLIEQVSEHMMAASPAPEPYLNTFDLLSSRARSSVKQASYDVLQGYPQDETEILTMLAARRYKNGRLPDVLERGATTGTRTMQRVLGHIPRAYRQKYERNADSPETLLEIAKNNYGFVLQEAQQHMLDLELKINLGKQTDEDSLLTYVSYAELDDTNQLAINPNIHQKFPHHFLEDGTPRSGEASTPTIWCPALYSKAIHSLWGWHLVGAERIYRREIEEQRLQSPIIIFPAETSLSAD